jgi:ATP-binding cassette subfamily F protein uup
MLRQEPVLDENATVLEACFDSENEAIIAVRDYERAVNSGDEQLMQKCMTRIEDLKAWDLEARIHEILDKLRLSNLDRKSGKCPEGRKKTRTCQNPHRRT